MYFVFRARDAKITRESSRVSGGSDEDDEQSMRHSFEKGYREECEQVIVTQILGME